MTTAFALEYIPRRMQELGYKNYFLKFRHIVLNPFEEKIIDAYSQFYFLIEAGEGLRVESEFGIYDLHFDNNTNEMFYEHQGKIIITNNLKAKYHVKFIQVIPKNKKKLCP